MRKEYRYTIQANSPSEYRRKLDKAIKDTQRKIVNDFRKEILKQLHKH